MSLNLSYTVTNLNDGTTYYFALTAENTSGASSGYSNEVSFSSLTQTATLTVNKQGNGNGTVTNSPTGSSFNPGTVVTLTATADVSSVFSGWSGVCSGTSPTCTATMNSNTTVTAAFNLKSYTITATAGANGSISPVGTTTVNYGANQTFTITPAAGYRVAAVTADGTSVGAVTSYPFSNVTANHTIYATFAISTTYTLTVLKNGTGTGSVTNSPTGSSFNPGTVVTLTATADVSSVFSGWSGVCSGTSPTCTATMNSNTTVTAAFNLKSYTITATAGANGSISPVGTNTVNHGASPTFTITPASGYRVAAVTVDGTSVGAVTSYTFSNVTANHTISATFAISTTYTLTVLKNGTGTGSVTNSPTGSSFNPGTVVTLTATADANSVFSGWSGSCGSNPTCKVTMNSNVTVTAGFNLKSYTITATAGANGSISPAGATTVNYGANQTFAITPASGYRVAAVTADGTSVEAVTSYTFSNVTANHTISATFAISTTYTLTVLKNGTGTGSVTNSPTGSSFNPGTVVTLTATADASSVFSGWSGGCGSSLTCTVTMNSNTTKTAGFNLKSYTITATAGANGSISPAGTTTVNHGANPTFTITPAAGYRVAAVTVDGTSVGAVTSYTFTNVTANHTINASFSTISNATYTLSVYKIGTGRGNVTKNPSGDRFNAGTMVTLTATPNNGSKFSRWSGACSGTNPVCKVTINSDAYVIAVFGTGNGSNYKVFLPLVVTD